MRPRRLPINFTRSFPDHRVEYDFKLYQQLNRDLRLGLRAWMQGISSNTADILPVQILNVATFIFIVLGFKYCYETEQDEYIIALRGGITGLKHGYMEKYTDKGQFDNMFNRYEKEPGQPANTTWSLREI